MAQQAHGDSGHATSIGTQGDQPVDGIAGSHPGTQEPSGAHVDAGKHRQREDGNRQHGGTAGQSQGGSGRNVPQHRTAATAGTDGPTMGSQGAGGARQGGSGDSMQGGAGARGQRVDDIGQADAPGGSLQRGGVSSRQAPD